MRIALIADVHGDIASLHTVLAQVQARRVDEVWCLGDVVGPSESAAFVALVRERCDLVLRGKWERMLVGDEDRHTAAGWRRCSPLRCRRSPVALTADATRWLWSLPSHAIRHGIRCYHGGAADAKMQWIATAADAAPTSTRTA